MCQQPGFSGGTFRESNGSRFFYRLWPEPVIRRETSPGVWYEIEDTNDDFNSADAKRIRDELIQQYIVQYPEIVAALKTGHTLDIAMLPYELAYLAVLDERIRKRETLLNAVPPEILGIIRRYPTSHFRLLRFVARYPEIIELITSNPLLGFMVATHAMWQKECDPSPDIGAILGWKRRDILERLGYPWATGATVKVIGHVAPEACKPDRISGFMETLRDPETVRRLSHIAAITTPMLKIIASPASLRHVTNGYLRDLALLPSKDAQLRAIAELELCLDLIEGNRRHENRLFRKPGHVHKLLACFANRLYPEDIERFSIDFPAPPLPDSDTIKALRGPREVEEESLLQENCVWTLLPDIAEGSLCLYRVLAPERATAAVRRNGNQHRLGEIECANNQPPSAETVRQVRQWFENAIHP